MASVKEAVDAAAAKFGGLDVLCNIAGIGSFKRFEELTEEDWNRTFAVNVTGMFHTVRAALPHLLATTPGCVVNVGSTASLRGNAYAAHYSASKAAVLLLTRSLALEFADRDLRFNCVCPGGVKTPLVRNFMRRADFDPHLVDYQAPPKTGHFADPIDIARIIAFLASAEARMINGAIHRRRRDAGMILDVLATWRRAGRIRSFATRIGPSLWSSIAWRTAPAMRCTASASGAATASPWRTATRWSTSSPPSAC
jgi:NAD(P)-dependent dehydrogenase (short-subunit alcohol dehydrogenase family)